MLASSPPRRLVSRSICSGARLSKFQVTSCSFSTSPPSHPPLQLHSSPLWSGFQAWRESPLNEHRHWGPNGPEPPLTSTSTKTSASTSEGIDMIGRLESASSLAELGALVLSTADPLSKSALSHLAYSRWRRENLPLGRYQPPSCPARSAKPEWVSPKEIPSPKSSEIPTRYGDMPAHNLLWRECEKSSDNVAARLAVIPLVQEARGLDAGPRLVQKLIGFGDLRTSKIVKRIAEEEVAHVAVGVYWFLAVCQKIGVTPCSTFKDLLKEYDVELKGPFNYSARDEAGIPREWYDTLSSNQLNTNERASNKEQLSAVYDRLSAVIAMESENSNLCQSSRL